MIRSLTDLRSIGPDFATLLVREAFVRQFRNRRALGGYVGLGGTPFSSGGSEREQTRRGSQPTGARGDGRTCVDVVALAAGQRIVRVVPRACRRNGRADQEDHDRRPGPQAARRLVALREGWRHSRRSKDETGVGTAFLSHAKQGRWSAVAAKNRGPVQAPMCRLDPPQRAPHPDAGIVVRDSIIPPDTRLAGSVALSVKPSSPGPTLGA